MSLRDRVHDYHRDPFFPTFYPLAVFFALRDLVKELVR